MRPKFIKGMYWLNQFLLILRSASVDPPFWVRYFPNLRTETERRQKGQRIGNDGVE